MHNISRKRGLSLARNGACALALFIWALFSLNLLPRAYAQQATTDAAALANEIVASGASIVLTGTPTLNAGTSTISAGIFRDQLGQLDVVGLTRGVVLSTGYLENAGVNGSGINDNSTNEFDIVTLTFSFIPKAGVTSVEFTSIFMSDEYRSSHSTESTYPYNDNFTIMLSGGSYNNVNVATIPGTTSKVSIQTLNSRTNSGYYRKDLSGTSVTVGGNRRYYAHSALLIHSFTVVPGTTYTATIRIADGGNRAGDSAVFIGTMPNIQLDLSYPDPGTGYKSTWDKSGGLPSDGISPEPYIIGENMRGENIRGTNSIGWYPTFSSATITLTNPLAGDLLSIAGTLPGGITASAYNPATGVLTLSGAGYSFEYQSALQQIRYSGTIGIWTRIINVVVYGPPIGSNPPLASNTATATIDIVSLDILKSYTLPPEAKGVARLGDIITYSYRILNSGSVPMRDISVVDMHGSPPVQVLGIADEHVRRLGKSGLAANTIDHTPNNGVWDVLEPWGIIVFTWQHTVTQAEVDHG